MDWRLLHLSRSVVPLHPRVFSDVPQSRFRSQDLWNSRQVLVLALCRISSHVSHLWKNLYVDSAWIGDCHLYNAVLFLCLVARLKMWHSRVFDLEIFKLLTKDSFGPPSYLLVRFSRAEKSLRGQCVDWVLSSLLCSLVPMHRRALRDVPHSQFCSRNLWDPLLVKVLTLPRDHLAGVLRVEQCLSEQCVDWRLSPISCSLVLLHLRAGSSRDL